LKKIQVQRLLILPEEQHGKKLLPRLSLTWCSWSAPEVFSGGGKYNARSDVYSYGIILWEIAHPGGIPFKEAEYAHFGFLNK